MTLVKPSRNATLNLAWEGLRKQQRAEKNAAKPAPEPVKKAAPKKPVAAKKTAKKGRKA